MIGVIIYATLEHNPHQTHTTRTSETASQVFSNPSIENKMGHVKAATMGSTLSAVKSESIRYIPIHLHKAIRTIRIIPEGQEAD